MSAEAHVGVHAIYPISFHSKGNLHTPKNCSKFHENPPIN